MQIAQLMVTAAEFQLILQFHKLKTCLLVLISSLIGDHLHTSLLRSALLRPGEDLKEKTGEVLDGSFLEENP